MPDNRPSDDGPTWEREESLFGGRSRTGELPSSPPPPADEVFRGPLFERPRSGEEAAPPLPSGSGTPAGEGLTDGPSRPTGHPGGNEGRPHEGGPGSGASEGPGPGDHGDDVAGYDATTFPRRERRAQRRRSGGSFVRELPVLLLIAFVLAFLLRTFVLQVFYIPSSSMEPTLQINDRMAVEKITYLFREPRRGEVVVFEGEQLGELDPDATFAERAVRGVGQFLGVVPTSARDLVKRVIGLPGDEIYIEDGQVFVNGEPIDEPYVVYHDGESYGPVTVPEDSLFFLGDNRPNSSDSRRGIGFVPMEDVVGRSVVVIWPPAHMGGLTGVEYDVPPPDTG